LIVALLVVITECETVAMKRCLVGCYYRMWDCCNEAVCPYFSHCGWNQCFI